jgi:hypothetical protein
MRKGLPSFVLQSLHIAHMNLDDFATALRNNPDKLISLVMPNGAAIPSHFHITEIGKVVKDFVDCGGTRRSSVSCMLQTLVANDTDHRISTSKLAAIVDKASVLGLTGDLPVEAEVQIETVGVYSVDSVTVSDDKLAFALSAKQTACLAPDACRLDVLPVVGQDGGCCGGETDCC